MKKRNTVLTFTTVLLVLFIFSIVGLADGNEDAMVRLLHASPDTPEVSIVINGNMVVNELDYKGTSDYMGFVPGQHKVEIFPLGEQEQPLLTQIISIESGKAYTAAAINSVESLDLNVFEDAKSVSNGQTLFRIAHLSLDSPNLDVLTNGKATFSNLTYTDVTFYVERSPMTIDLEISNASTKEQILSAPSTQLEADALYTFLVVGLTRGEPPIDTIILADQPRELPSEEMIGTAVTGERNVKEESIILGGFLMMLITMTSIFLFVRQQPWQYSQH
ncbi:DUF4397 domain-containing protein [Salipaludibacillus sp. HK11]|uniref:DUF4397 domain-containing protein n=1 Tax=Salipaludibacillus sp. HK11 TaxID=3394320 RepID=UPI0039FD9A62